jgi:hypothetical protein
MPRRDGERQSGSGGSVRGAVVGAVAVLMLILAANVVLPQPRPGVEPQDARTCPLSHPIKGNFTTYSGER